MSPSSASISTPKPSKRLRMGRYNVLDLTQIGILAALSLVLLYLLPGGGISLFGAAPWLKYDLVDIPVLVATLTIGFIPGLIILALVSAIQSFVIGASGFFGFLMHMLASSVLIALPALVMHFFPKLRFRLPIGLLLGGLGMTAIMIPLNIVIVPLYTGMPLDKVWAILPITLLFNVIKASLNAFIAWLVLRGLRPYLHRTLQSRAS